MQKFLRLFGVTLAMRSDTATWAEKLKKLDYYTKTASVAKKQSSLGGVFALIVFAIMFVLLVSEFSEWLIPRHKDSLSVDVIRGEKLKISFDITFHRLPCDDVTIDLLDESGAHFTAIGHDVKKHALDAEGNVLRVTDQPKLSEAADLLELPGYCHDCTKELPEEAVASFLELRKRNAIPACCNSCPALVITYQMLRLPTANALQKLPCAAAAGQFNRAHGEVGCRAAGYIDIHKIGGNFHVAAGRSGSQSHGTHTHHMHRVNFETLKNFNISHTIHKLHFGEGFYGKGFDPLNGLEQMEQQLAQYTYYINVVPTVFVHASGRETPSHQYSYTVHREVVDLASRNFKLPGMFVKYSFDALRMTKRAHPNSSFTHFITRVCALLGGSYVFLGLIYRAFSTVVDLAKKND